jgi:mono/diheme cytochrome c family protein
MGDLIIRGCMLVMALAALAQTTGPPTPSLVIRSLAGRDLFGFYCATCHGRDGKGNGPVVAALKVHPPDLTWLARRNGGTFLRQRVEAFVTNSGNGLTPAHGNADMPVWGPIFRGLDPSDALVRLRIANVVEYIESLQAK